MNGLREFARRRGSVVSYLPLDEELRLADAEGHLRTAMSSRGGAIAFNVLEPDGTAIPFASVVDRARECGVSLRGGCFCNPGAAEAAFGFPYAATAKCLRTAATDGFSIDKFSQCLGPGIPVGAVRASLGIPSNKRDIDRAIEVVESLSTGD